MLETLRELLNFADIVIESALAVQVAKRSVSIPLSLKVYLERIT